MEKTDLKLTYTSSEKDGYLLIEFVGIISNVNEWLEKLQLGSEIVEQYGAEKVLVDNRNIHVPMDTMTLHELIQSYQEVVPPEKKNTKIANLVNEEIRHLAELWEELCSQSGIQYKSFTTMEEAIAWLKE